MPTVSFQQSHSRALRLWHWLTFLIILLIFYTVFVAKFTVNPWDTAPVVKQALQKQGITLTDEQARMAVGNLDEGVWNWHKRFGYVLAGLFVFRILLEFLQPRDERFFVRTKAALKTIKAKSSLHYFIVRIIYLLFYGVLATVVVTGLLLTFYDGIWDRDRLHLITELHESCFYLVLFFAFVHVSGVLLAGRSGYRNIVSNMIHGSYRSSLPAGGAEAPSRSEGEERTLDGEKAPLA